MKGIDYNMNNDVISKYFAFIILAIHMCGISAKTLEVNAEYSLHSFRNVKCSILICNIIEI